MEFILLWNIRWQCLVQKICCEFFSASHGTVYSIDKEMYFCWSAIIIFQATECSTSFCKSGDVMPTQQTQFVIYFRFSLSRKKMYPTIVHSSVEFWMFLILFCTFPLRIQIGINKPNALIVFVFIFFTGYFFVHSFLIWIPIAVFMYKRPKFYRTSQIKCYTVFFCGNWNCSQSSFKV